MKRASQLTDKEIAAELKKLGDKWDRFRANCDGGGGSPGEWMVERIGALEHEQKKRAAQQTAGKEPAK
jgi:hypothetical protein